MFKRLIETIKTKEPKDHKKVAIVGVAFVAAYVLAAIAVVYALFKFLGPL